MLGDIEMKKFIKQGIKRGYVSTKPHRQQLYYIYKLIVNRYKFKYTAQDFVRNFIDKLCCCCKLKNSSKSFKQAAIRGKQFERGQKKIKEDLDIIKLIQNNVARVVNQQVLYDADERYLLKFQKRNCINSNSESQLENSQANSKYDLRYLSRQDSKTNFESKTKRILQEVQSQRQQYQMRRLLLGVTTTRNSKLVFKDKARDVFKGSSYAGNISPRINLPKNRSDDSGQERYPES